MQGKGAILRTFYALFKNMSSLRRKLDMKQKEKKWSFDHVLTFIMEKSNRLLAVP